MGRGPRHGRSPPDDSLTALSDSQRPPFQPPWPFESFPGHTSQGVTHPLGNVSPVTHGQKGCPRPASAGAGHLGHELGAVPGSFSHLCLSAQLEDSGVSPRSWAKPPAFLAQIPQVNTALPHPQRLSSGRQ